MDDAAQPKKTEPQPLIPDDKREHRALVAAQLYLDARALLQMFPCPRTEKIEADIFAYLESIGEAV